MTNEEKQELARKVWIASSILVIAIITGLFPGYWFFVLCFIGVAWPVEKKIEEVFSKEIKNAGEKLFGFFNVVYDSRIKPTWLGRFLDNTFPLPVANDLEETESEQSHDSDSGSYSESISSIMSQVESDDENLSAPSTAIDDEEKTEVKSIASTVASSNSSTIRISSVLGQSISSPVSNFTTESKQAGYDSDTEFTDDKEDFVLIKNDDQLTISSQQANEPNLQRSLRY